MGNINLKLYSISNLITVNIAQKIKGVSNNEKTKKYRKIRKQNPNFKETTEEFLSGWHPDDRLVPVITVTIYFGNDGWDAAKRVQ